MGLVPSSSELYPDTFITLAPMLSTEVCREWSQTIPFGALHPRIPSNLSNVRTEYFVEVLL